MTLLSLLLRNIKAIENQLVRKVIASRSPSPGPGHYQGLSMANTLNNNLSVPSPQRMVQEKCPSPGKKGFSFGKASLTSSIGTYDPQGRLTVSVYEFKPSMTSPSQRNSGLYSSGGYGGGGGGDAGSIMTNPTLQRVNSFPTNASK